MNKEQEQMYKELFEIIASYLANDVPDDLDDLELSEVVLNAFAKTLGFQFILLVDIDEVITLDDVRVTMDKLKSAVLDITIENGGEMKKGFEDFKEKELG